jgi:hypothetical protein
LPKLTDAIFAARVRFGAERVKAAAVLAGDQVNPIGVAAAHAIQQAGANPGCLVRVYYKTVDECLDLSDLIWGSLDSLMQLDKHRTHENLDAGKILFEVINGSGIALLLEKGD